MEECPKCGRITVELNPARKRIECYSSNCDFRKPVDVDKWYEAHNVLPELARGVEMRNKLYPFHDLPPGLWKYFKQPTEEEEKAEFEKARKDIEQIRLKKQRLLKEILEN